MVLDHHSRSLKIFLDHSTCYGYSVALNSTVLEHFYHLNHFRKQVNLYDDSFGIYYINLLD